MTVTEKRIAAAVKKREARRKKIETLTKQRDKVEHTIETLQHKHSVSLSKLRAKVGALRVKIAAV